LPASQLDVTKRREAEAIIQQRQQHLDGLGSVAAALVHEFDNLITIVKGSLEQARDLENLGSRGNSQPEGQEPAAAMWPGDDTGSGQSTMTPRYDAALILQPVWVDTQEDDEEGFLVFGDGRLVAVLVRLSDQHGALAGQWYFEHGFGPLDGLGHPHFASLDAAREWVGRQLGQVRASREADGSAAASRTRLN